MGEFTFIFVYHFFHIYRKIQLNKEVVDAYVWLNFVNQCTKVGRIYSSELGTDLKFAYKILGCLGGGKAG